MGCLKLSVNKDLTLKFHGSNAEAPTDSFSRKNLKVERCNTWYSQNLSKAIINDEI